MATSQLATVSSLVSVAESQSAWSRKDMNKRSFLTTMKSWTVGQPLIQRTGGVHWESLSGLGPGCRGVVILPRAGGRPCRCTAVVDTEQGREDAQGLERWLEAEEVARGSRSPSLFGRRLALEGMVVTAAVVAAAALGYSDEAAAVSSSRRVLRTAQIPESEYTLLPNGLKYYDLKVGSGAQAVKGARVAVHYVAKWKGITFMTSRQGLGVTGGTPYGFDVGSSENGYVLKGLDLGVQGMREGGQRLLIVPPELAYGNNGVQEIPPNSTLQFEIELLSIKKSPFGSRVKIIEG